MAEKEGQMSPTHSELDQDKPRNCDVEMTGDTDEEEIVESEDTVQKPTKTKKTTQKPGQKEAALCLACNKKCTGSQASVLCQLCSLWCHKNCAGISDAVFKSLTLQVKEVGTAYWACKSCLSFAAKTNALLKNMNNQLAAMDAKIERNSEEIGSAKREICKMDSGLKRVERKVDEVKNQVEDDIYVELRERESRRLNLIIHGLPEPERARDNRERSDMDKEECGRIFRSIEAGIRPDQIKFCRRLGEKGRDPRPIAIGLTSEETKRRILDKARNIQRTKYENVSIVADLTRKQRQEESKMLEEAEKRNRNLTEEDRSKNLKWMVVGRKGEKRMIKERTGGQIGPRRDMRNGEETGARRKEYGGWNPRDQRNRRSSGGTDRYREETGYRTQTRQEEFRQGRDRDGRRFTSNHHYGQEERTERQYREIRDSPPPEPYGPVTTERQTTEEEPIGRNTTKRGRVQGSDSETEMYNQRSKTLRQ